MDKSKTKFSSRFGECLQQAFFAIQIWHLNYSVNMSVELRGKPISLFSIEVNLGRNLDNIGSTKHDLFVIFPELFPTSNNSSKLGFFDEIIIEELVM